MGFSQDFIEKVRESNNIVDLVGQYTVLRQSANGFMGRCPFPDHNDKTASFSVSESKQLFHCFGCKKSGTAFNFVQMYLGFGFPEAVEYLAGRAGLTVEREGGPSSAQRDRLQVFYDANQKAYEGFRDGLLSLGADSPVHQYLEKRGLTREICEEFGLGYAPESWDFICKKLRPLRMDDNTLQQCGLVIARKGDKKGFYDRFRDRLMFPIFNTMGRCLGFGGRILGPGEPKYLNSPETPVFHKSRVLYGLDRNAKHIRSGDEAILVEGYMDVIALAQFGVNNVAATLGTALTADHAKILKRMTRNVLVLFDGDQAGITAAEKSLPILLKAGLIPRGLTLPDSMDPDDYVRANGVEMFQQQVRQAPQLFDLVVNRWLEGYGGTAGEKMKLVDRLAPVAAQIADSSLRQLYLKELAAKINLDEAWLRSALWQRIKNSGAAKDFTEPQGPPPGPSLDHIAKHQVAKNNEESIRLKNAAKAELTLLGLALKTERNFNLVVDSGVSEYLADEGVKQLYSRLLDRYRQAPEGFDKLLASVLPFVDHPEKMSAAFEEANEEDSLAEHRMVEDCIEKIKGLHLKRRGSNLSVEAKMNPSSDNLEEFMNIHKQRLGLRHIKDNYETED